MRKPKKPKTELIHKIEDAWAKTERGQKILCREDAEILMSIYGTLYYLGVYDALKGTRHKECFIKRHLMSYKNLSQLQISEKYKICVDTVSDYCLMYLDVFESCLIETKTFMNLQDNKEIKVTIIDIVNKWCKIGKNDRFSI